MEKKINEKNEISEKQNGFKEKHFKSFQKY